MNEYLKKLKLSNEVEDILKSSKSLIFPKSREELIELSFGNENKDSFCREANR